MNRPPPASAPTVAPAPLPPGEVARLVGGWHHDPHGVLGAHPVPRGTAVRVLRPLAERVVVDTGGARFELTHQQDGLFTALIPGDGDAVLPAYRLRVVYQGVEVVQDDGYRMAPTVGEVDLHLIGQGRHEELWTALGAQVRTVDGVAGTGFAVWAPNASGVRLIGDFNAWSGTAHPMRSLGGSGVWELFVPGVGPGARYKFE
ncbi:1,4-alpha-glucan branching enzyme, partial [Streptacidiphilus sp. MAP12-16]